MYLETDYCNREIHIREPLVIVLVTTRQSSFSNIEIKKRSAIGLIKNSTIIQFEKKHVIKEITLSKTKTDYIEKLFVPRNNISLKDHFIYMKSKTEAKVIKLL